MAGRAPLGAGDVARGAPAFPLVGAALGAAVAGAALGLVALGAGALLAAALAVALGAVLTGALHVDALADCADGFGGRTPEQRLAIMRDHTLGAFGVTALVLDLLVRTSAVAALLGLERGGGAIVAAGALSRAVPVVLVAALPPAPRPEGGHGLPLAGATSAARAAATAALALGVALLALHAAALAPLGAALAGGAVSAWWSRSRLGGVTGDTLGAALELSEALGLAAAAVALA